MARDESLWLKKDHCGRLAARMGEPLGGRAGAEGAAGGREPPVRSIAEEPGGEEAWTVAGRGGHLLLPKIRSILQNAYYFCILFIPHKNP